MQSRKGPGCQDDGPALPAPFKNRDAHKVLILGVLIPSDSEFKQGLIGYWGLSAGLLELEEHLLGHGLQGLEDPFALRSHGLKPGDIGGI